MTGWKNTTIHSSGSEHDTPNTWGFISTCGAVISLVRKHRYHPDREWLLTCQPWYKDYPIANKDVLSEGEAKETAIDLVRTKLKIMFRNLEKENARN